MDYKEKYEMALEGIQEILSSGEDSIKMSRLQLRLQGIFPELKEGEDERIRKSIIGFLIAISSLKDGKTVSNEDFDSKAILEWVAWLKKQKDMEVKLIISDEGYNKAFQDGIEDVLTNLHKYGLEKQGEHKPAEWSEDDQSSYNEICSLIYDNYGLEDASMLLTWFNELKDRVLPQPKQECGEEDELSCFESALFTSFSDAWQEYLNGEEVNVKQWAKEHSKEILEAAKEELKEQKSAWSEEDENEKE